jgi:hypothetical protein
MHIDNKYSEHDSYVVTQLRQYQANNDQESAQRTLQYTSSNFPVCRIKSSNSDYLPSTKDRLNAILDKKDGLTIMDNVTHLQDVLKDMISEMKNPPKNNFMGDPDCILKAKEFFQFLNVKTPFTFDNLLEQLTFDNCANYQDYEQEKYIATMNSNMAFCKKYGFTSSENSYIYNDLDNSIYFDQATNSVIYSDQNFYFVAFKNEDKGWNVYHSQQTTEEFEKLFENTVPLENLVLKIDKTKFKQVASHMYSFHYNVYGTPYAFSCEDKTEFVAKTKPKMK